MPVSPAGARRRRATNARTRTGMRRDSAMARQDWQTTIADGMSVYGSDGDKVGTIVSVGPSYVVVEKGFFFPTDYYIPFSAIASQTENGVYLNVTKDAALNQGWDVVP